MSAAGSEATALDPSWPAFTTPIELWGQEQSINTHKTALMLRMCEVPFTFHAVNIQKGDHKAPEYEARNPFGRVPTFRQGDLVLCQTINQLDYLARRTGRFGAATIMERYEIENWANFATDYFSVGLARLRFINRFGAPPGLDGAMLKDSPTIRRPPPGSTASPPCRATPSRRAGCAPSPGRRHRMPGGSAESLETPVGGIAIFGPEKSCDFNDLAVA